MKKVIISLQLDLQCFLYPQSPVHLAKQTSVGLISVTLDSTIVVQCFAVKS
jgi:hypothetical protein